MNEYSKKSMITLLLIIAAAVIITAMVITLSTCAATGHISIWNVIDAVASIAAIALGMHYYIPKK